MTDPTDRLPPAADAPSVCGWCLRPMSPTETDFGDPDNGWYEHLHERCLKPASAKSEKDQNTNTEAQEEACAALWDFAQALGVTPRPELVGPALDRIVKAYGFNVAEIQ